MKRKECKYPAREHGFTLVEVLASLVILSVLLAGVYNLMLYLNKAAISNNDRLVAINLGKGAMERMQLDPASYLVDKGTFPKTMTAAACTNDTCRSLYEPFVNDETYMLTVEASQTPREKELGLVNVLVTVQGKENRVTNQIEGYVNIQ
ncbi:prepilin-type N-terminal cleavage/methylation domain-containing protein [Aciduricibacillus chroicocephali]|uniref:Prepilin-type N-terminal cleavage/methylation domain-containing protein n=1 Tax=Aciduricibacillus chroicocephali TaxID=3054939 RepID=A0ABY9KTI8_9BACI|nr:prepilin-type N-terminal cleavage/methylation domain-containing protein [Bacillaceae bacterium 44XB]